MTSPPKLQGPETCCFFKKVPYLSRMKNCSRHADLFVRLFARAIISEVPPTLSVKISTLYHNFLIDYCRDFSHILHICTRPQIPLCEYQAWSCLNFCVTSIHAAWQIGIASSSNFVASAASVVITLCISDSISKMACQI